MFRITSRVRDDELVLKLEGCLAGAWVRVLDACWQEAAKNVHEFPIRLDLTDVCHVDEAGRNLMAQMYRAGARFTASGCVMPELVREIAEATGEGRRH